MRYLSILILIQLLAACGGGSSGGSGSSASITPASSQATSVSSSLLSSSLDSSSQSSSQMTSTSSSNTNSSAIATMDDYQLYGLYVSPGTGGVNSLLGNSEKEDAFIQFLRNNGFNYVIFYDLEGLVANSTRANQLATLIARARSIAGMRQVAAALGDATEANTIVAYNNQHSIEQRIDVLNVEFEFWNQTDRATAFSNALSLLDQFKSVANANQLQTEIYIGWITQEEALELAARVDRLLVHVYRQNDIDIVNYGIERLEYLAAANNKVRIAPIFSNEGPANTNDIPFMGEWLETHPHQQAFESWQSGFEAINADWKNNIQVSGAVWFIYDKFLDLATQPINHLNSQPESQSACAGDSVEFSVASNAISKTVCWVHNGRCLEDDASVSGSSSETLNISPIETSHFGSYHARVTSKDPQNPSTFASQEVSLSMAGHCPE
jgi:hypothetical protein